MSGGSNIDYRETPMSQPRVGVVPDTEVVRTAPFQPVQRGVERIHVWSNSGGIVGSENSAHLARTFSQQTAIEYVRGI